MEETKKSYLAENLRKYRTLLGVHRKNLLSPLALQVVIYQLLKKVKAIYLRRF